MHIPLFLQIYMGVLTQKCIKRFPVDLAEKILYHNNGSLNVNSAAEFDRIWAAHNLNQSNW
jgi:hypothetical protein